MGEVGDWASGDLVPLTPKWASQMGQAVFK